ncbi:MAG: hypothetical protein ACFE8M_09785 [Candidatus Hermodarchaeota archaeon]
MDKKKRIMVVLGSIILGLSILGMAFGNWLIDIGIWIVPPILGIINGGFLMFYGIYSALETVKAKGFFQIITGLIIIGLCIVWIIIIYWPVITGERPHGLGLEAMEVGGPLTGIILGGLLMIFGFKNVSKSRRKYIIKEKAKVEAASKVTYKIRKPIIKESIGTKMKAATNIIYMLRFEKEVGESGAERITYICGYCGVKNNLKSINEDRGIFQCLNCGAENHLLK